MIANSLPQKEFDSSSMNSTPIEKEPVMECRDRGITDASIGGHDFQQIACQQCLNLSLQVS